MYVREMQILTAAVFVALAAAAVSQMLEKPNSNPSPNPLKISAPGCSNTGSLRAPQPPQPYFVELKTTTVQTLANGTTITNERSETDARDSQGRSLSTHMMTTYVGSDGTNHVETMTHVNDPLEDTQTDWNSQQKEATVLKLPPQEERHGCWADESGHLRISYGPIAPRVRPTATLTPRPVQQPLMERPKTEDIGTSVIEGLEVHELRTTTVVPAGRIGNDQALVSTTDAWFSPLIPRPLREITDDPRMGKSTTEVVRLDLSDPPLETFQPPEGYTVKVEELHQVECGQR